MRVRHRAIQDSREKGAHQAEEIHREKQEAGMERPAASSPGKTEVGMEVRHRIILGSLGKPASRRNPPRRMGTARQGLLAI